MKGLFALQPLQIQPPNSFQRLSNIEQLNMNTVRIIANVLIQLNTIVFRNNHQIVPSLETRWICQEIKT